MGCTRGFSNLESHSPTKGLDEMGAGTLLGLFGMPICYDDARVAAAWVPILVAIRVAPAIFALRVVIALAPRDIIEGKAVPFVAEFEFNLFHWRRYP